MPSLLAAYLALALAIALEFTGSAFLQMSAQFTRPWPTAAMALCYCASFYALSHALKVLPLGIAYAIWAGAGIILTTAMGFLLFRQALDAAALLGVGLIVSGVVVLNLFSRTAGH